MAGFKDKEGREWKLQLDAPTIIRVREECDPQFMVNDATEGDNTATRLADDQVLLCLVLYQLCAKQCEKRELDRESFLSEVIADGDTIQSAVEALGVAITNFTPPRKRAFISAVAKERQAAEEYAMAQGMARLSDPAMQTQIRQKIDEALNKAFARLGSATDSQDSAESPLKD